MSDLPKAIRINEEGPREGFQFEKGHIPTERKLELIDALSGTGVKEIQVVSFVNPKRVPGMADADEVVARMNMREGVRYTALWLNEQGLQRALAAKRVDVKGRIVLCASDAFLKRNTNMTPEENRQATRNMLQTYREHGVPTSHGGLQAAFGCNFEGDISTAKVLAAAESVFSLAREHDVTLKTFALADTMAWATPGSVKRVVGALRERYPDVEFILHLHDTRGMGIANAYAGLQMGVRIFDASVAGLGGCPFAGHKGAAGNVCTEDLVFMCDEMGIETGINLEELIRAAQLAEEVVGHPLPGSVMKGGSLARLREAVSAAA
ncbi:hydroxymethylglutaryl-CoA lyase [Agaricicola taiwanensis]|uniref:Hydroxymethylglutaryl-CoA lyase n=1 Tax=Agaricicola taiwanensis TaxID=591372 RepID=A0A8J2YJ89_9RHOB|nr:hydroxymethylglutaryl-CoA lyase [Agaricicola taiwanensis]GGE46229.1 hydroxymethylglutaryl-CoA lyase [Agaricicola taiwanensis]